MELKSTLYGDQERLILKGSRLRKEQGFFKMLSTNNLSSNDQKSVYLSNRERRCPSSVSCDAHVSCQDSFPVQVSIQLTYYAEHVFKIQVS